DAVVPLIGQAHPHALGSPAADSRTELWEIGEPCFEAVLTTGFPRRLPDQLLLTSGARIEERYFDITLSPVLHAGEVAGVLCAATETTRRVQSARRSAMLAELSARTSAAPNEETVWSEAVAALEFDPADLPFTLLYAFEPGGVAVLAGSVGLRANSPRAPSHLGPDAAAPWPVAKLKAAREPLEVHDALVCPLVPPGGEPCGFFVAGLSPRQPLDDAYREFLGAAAERIAAGIAAARSRDELARREASLERARRRLEQRCAELTQLFEHAPIPTFVIRGGDFVVERLNRFAATVAANRELVGKPLFESLPELASQGFEHRLRRVLETGVPDVGQEVVVRLERDGRLEERYVTFITAPLQLGADAEPRIIVVAIDVTEQVQSRAALEASEARYRSIFDGVDVAIWVIDLAPVLPLLEELKAGGVDDLRAFFARHPEFLRHAASVMSLVDVNEATLRIYGARDKEELARSLPRLFDAESWKAFGEMLLAVFEHRHLVRVDAVVSTLAGERREVMMTAAPIGDRNGPGRVLVTQTDITDRKRMELALREADRQKDEFLATLAHELRNPLAPLRSSVDLLRAVPGNAPETVVDIVERQVEYLVRLAEDLFESWRIRRGAYDLRK